MKNNQENTPDKTYKPGDGPIGCAILGCITAGAIALIAAASMKTGLEIAFCIIAAVIAFSATHLMFTRRSK